MSNCNRNYLCDQCSQWQVCFGLIWKWQLKELILTWKSYSKKKLCTDGSCWVTNVVGFEHLIKTTHNERIWFEASKIWYWNKCFVKIWNIVPRQFLRKKLENWVSLSSRTHEFRLSTQSFDMSKSRLDCSMTSWTYVIMCEKC